MDDTIQDARSVDPVGVPRRFSLGALMVIMTVYSVLFGMLSSLGASPTLFGSVALLFTGVGLAQMVFFGGKRPRDASYLAGIIICPMLLLAAFLIDHGLGNGSPWKNGTADMTVMQLIASMVYLAGAGIPLGYMAGCTAAGIFLVMDMINEARGIEGVESEPLPGSLTEEDLEDVEERPSFHERAWNRTRRIAFWLSPLQKGRPFRQALNSFILLAVLVGLATPFTEWEAWWVHPLITLGVAITPLVLIGTWLARWKPLLLIQLGDICAAGPALLSEGIFISSRDTLSEEISVGETLALGCGVGWLATVIFGWARRWRDNVCAKKQITRSNRRLAVATAVSLLVLFGALSLVMYQISRQPIQRAMTRLSALDASIGKIDCWWGDNCDLEEIDWIVLDDTEVTNADLTCLDAFSNLAVLSLSNTGITDTGLAHVGKLEGLKHISLDGTQVTDAGLKHLRKNGQLDWLSLMDCPVKGPGLAHLKGLPIQILELSGSDVCDAELTHLTGLSKLQLLDLQSTRVTGTGFQDLSPFPSLIILDLTRSAVSDEGLQHLQGLTGLVVLNLTETSVTGTGLNDLKGLPGLQRLVLDNSLLSDVGLENFQGLPNLATLELDGTQVGDAGLERLSRCPKLTYLHLNRTQITDAGLPHLKGLVNLENLLLKDTQVTDAGLAHLKTLPSLINLDLQGTEITDNGLQQLSGLGTLECVLVEGTHVTHEGVEKFKAALPTCRVYGAE